MAVATVSLPPPSVKARPLPPVACGRGEAEGGGGGKGAGGVAGVAASDDGLVLFLFCSLDIRKIRGKGCGGGLCVYVYVCART